MLFYLTDMHWPRDGAAIDRAIRARDDRALVVGDAGTCAVRVVARLDLRRMLEAFTDAGFRAVPETRIPAPTRTVPTR